MALVLRNAALQKQVSLLKCMKTRTVVTTAKQNNQRTPLSSAVLKMPTLRKIFKAAFKIPSFKMSFASTPKRNVHTTATALPLYQCVSCPEFHEDYLDDRTQFQNDSWLKARSTTNFTKPTPEAISDNVSSKFPLPNTLQKTIDGSGIFVPSVFDTIANAACPCPCPCPRSPCGPCCGNAADCNCGRLLPPPCNTPPKCIQYMQGYYYYPYGTWFCGPYHVNTGAVPVCGPVCPGTACGIAPPNPNLLCKCPPCTCGLISCSICNPPTSSSPSAQGFNMPSAQGFNMPSAQGFNMPSAQGFNLPSAQGFNMPSSQGFTMPGAQGFNIPSAQGFNIPSAQGFNMPYSQGPAATTPQGSYGMPCTQLSWGDPAPIEKSGLPLPFDVPGSTIQKHGTGYHIFFPSTSSPGPAVPNWATQHAPCECTEGLENSKVNVTPATKIDTPKVMQSILEPFTKAFPTAKEPNKTSRKGKEPQKLSKILENPKVKTSFP